MVTDYIYNNINSGNVGLWAKDTTLKEIQRVYEQYL